MNDNIIKKICQLREQIQTNESYMSIDVDKEYWQNIFEYCLENNYDVYVSFKGINKYCCNYCCEWQDANIKSEYCETADILGYNPPQSPFLNYSDYYYYCEKCGEDNFIDNDYECLEEYVEDGIIRFDKYEMENKLYIFDDEKIDNLDDLNVYLNINKILVAYYMIDLNDLVINKDDYDDCFFIKPEKLKYI